MGEIKLTEEQKTCLKPYVTCLNETEFGYMVAIRAAKRAHDELHKKMRELIPNAISIKYPDEGDWYAITCEE